MNDSNRTDADGDDEEWRFGLDDVGGDATGTGTEAEADDEVPERGPIEPESPSIENAFFVAVGAAATVAMFATALLPV